MRSASRGPYSTDDTVDRPAPDDRTIDEIRRSFAALGFATGPIVAAAFSIEADDTVFDDVFPSASPITELSGHRSGEVELPLDDLPPALGPLVADIVAVAFTAPPDFGPGNP